MGDRRFALAAVVLIAATGVALATEGPDAKNYNEGVTSPYLIPESRVAPEYPAAAFDARMEGAVTLAALVLRDGTVAYVDTLDSTSPNLGFESAAADAVRQWRFEPGLLAGDAIDAFAVVRLSFRRNGGSRGSGYVTAGFMPVELLGASVVADLGVQTGGGADPTGGGVSMSATDSPGSYHPQIPPGLFPGASYHRQDWWPKNEMSFDDISRNSNPEFGISDK